MQNIANCWKLCKLGDLEIFNNRMIIKTKSLNKILQLKLPNGAKIPRKHGLSLEKTYFLWYNISCS